VIVGLNPTGGMESVVSVVCCQVGVSATSWSLVQRSPTDCGVSRRCVWSRNLVNEEVLAHWGLSCQINICLFGYKFRLIISDWITSGLLSVLQFGIISWNWSDY